MELSYGFPVSHNEQRAKNVDGEELKEIVNIS